MVKEKTKHHKDASHKSGDIYHLILFNDEVNTFDFVIETLIDVCEHEAYQAEQCAWITHLKGKCAVMSDVFERIESAGKEMSNRGLTVSIELSE